MKNDTCHFTIGWWVWCVWVSLPKAYGRFALGKCIWKDTALSSLWLLDLITLVPKQIAYSLSSLRCVFISTCLYSIFCIALHCISIKFNVIIILGWLKPLDITIYLLVLLIVNFEFLIKVVDFTISSIFGVSWLGWFYVEP